MVERRSCHSSINEPAVGRESIGKYIVASKRVKMPTRGFDFTVSVANLVAP